MNGSVVTAKIAGMRVHREDQVGDFHQQQHDEQRRGQAQAVLAHEELVLRDSRCVTGMSLLNQRTTGLRSG